MSDSSNVHGNNPGTVRVTVVSADGQRRTVDMSEQEYRRLARRQRFSSPLESLFGGRGSLFDDFFSDFGDDGNGRPATRAVEPSDDPAGGAGRAIPVRSGQGRRGA